MRFFFTTSRGKRRKVKNYPTPQKLTRQDTSSKQIQDQTNTRSKTYHPIRREMSCFIKGYDVNRGARNHGEININGNPLLWRTKNHNIHKTISSSNTCIRDHGKTYAERERERASNIFTDQKKALNIHPCPTKPKKIKIPLIGELSETQN